MTINFVALKKDRTAAERQRRYRQRQREGITCVQVELPAERLAAMVEKRYLTRLHALNSNKVAEAIDSILESVLGA